jgi:hypothetical protein
MKVTRYGRRYGKGPLEAAAEAKARGIRAISARIRSYLSTCQKHAIHATEALDAIFHGRLPEIIARLE